MENRGYVDEDRPEHITWPRLTCILFFFFGGGGDSETPIKRNNLGGQAGGNHINGCQTLPVTVHTDTYSIQSLNLTEKTYNVTE